MARIVMKFGGTSLGTTELISKAGTEIAQRAKHDQVVVVVSAMGHTTDELITMMQKIAVSPNPRSLDMLLTSGERISMALMTEAIRSGGSCAVGLTGDQAGIFTDERHGNARILEMNPARIEAELVKGNVVVVAGFQGLSPDGEFTTLGRGGSDTTAVALAHALTANRCEIVTDVDGVYTADPRIYPGARRLDWLSLGDMLEMSAAGAGVLAQRAADYALRYNVDIFIRSAFNSEGGTLIEAGSHRMEQAIITGITHDTSRAIITVSGIPDKPGMAGKLFRAIGEAGISVGTIVQGGSETGTATVQFSVGRDSADAANAIAANAVVKFGGKTKINKDVVRVSIVGAAMNESPLIAARMFDSLGNEGINILLVSTSENTVTTFVDQNRLEDAVRVIHQEFDPPLMLGA